MVNVCMLFSSYLESPNGASRFVREFENNKGTFSEYDINVSVVSMDTFHPSSFSSIVHKRRGGSKLKRKLIDLINKNSILTILFDMIVYQSRKDRFIDMFMTLNTIYDIIHCTEPDLCYSLIKRRKLSTEKIFLTMHNNGDALASEYISRPALNTKLGRLYLKRKLKYVFDHVQRIGLTTQQSVNVFLKLHPEIDHDKVYYVYNGIESLNIIDARKLPKDRPLKFVCVGTIWERKNQKAIVDALIDMTDEERRKISVTFVGDGLLREPLENLCKRESLGNVSFIGSVPDISDCLENSDVFILVSHSEGLPLSIIQAMRIGLPIVGSNIPGINEMVEDGKSGYLTGVDFKSVKETMIKMAKLSDNEYDKMSRASYQLFLNKFTISKMIMRYSEEYNRQ